MEQLEVEEARRGPTSGWLGASFNFINSIVGAGIVGLPFALRESGLFIGILMLLGVAAMVYHGAVTIVRAGTRYKVNSYEDLCYALFGKTGFYAVCAFMFLFTFGGMVLYLIIIGDNIPRVAQDNGSSLFTNRSFSICFFAILLILPLCLLKDMSKLEYSSMLSIGAVVVIIIVVVAVGTTAADDQSIHMSHEDAPLAFARSGLIRGLGAIMFAFVCHHNSFIVYNSLTERTLLTWRRVALFSVGVSFVLSLMLSVGGYLAFFSHTKGDILTNLGERSAAANTARVLLSLTMVFTFPMEQFVARHAIHSMRQGPGSPKTEEWNPVWFYGTTLFLWSLALLLGLVLTDVGIVLEVVGSLSASFIGFILPAIIALTTADVHWKQRFGDLVQCWDPASESYLPTAKERLHASLQFVGTCSMLVFGVVALFYGTISSFIESS